MLNENAKILKKVKKVTVSWNICTKIEKMKYKIDILKRYNIICINIV